MPKANAATTAPAGGGVVAVPEPDEAPATKTTTKITSFAPLDDVKEKIKWLLYGPEGSGKTTAALKAANRGPVLVLNIEGGLKKAALRRQGVNTANIQVWPAPGEVVTARSLEALHEKLLGDLMDDPDAWYGILLDSITETHHQLREQATDQRVEKAAKRKVEIDPDFVDRDDYGVMTNQLRKIIRRFRDLPCHVMITALEKIDDDTKEKRPNISPALAADLMGYMDIVSAHKATDDDFRALTRRSPLTRAKDRFGTLPKVMAEPDFERVLAYVEGEFETGGDDLQDAYDKVAEEKAAAKAAEEAEKAAAKVAAKKRTPAKKATPTSPAPAAAETEEKEEA